MTSYNPAVKSTKNLTKLQASSEKGYDIVRAIVQLDTD